MEAIAAAAITRTPAHGKISSNQHGLPIQHEAPFYPADVKAVARSADEAAARMYAQLPAATRQSNPSGGVPFTPVAYTPSPATVAHGFSTPAQAGLSQTGAVQYQAGLGSPPARVSSMPVQPLHAASGSGPTFSQSHSPQSPRKATMMAPAGGVYVSPRGVPQQAGAPQQVTEYQRLNSSMQGSPHAWQGGADRSIALPTQSIGMIGATSPKFTTVRYGPTGTTATFGPAHLSAPVTSPRAQVHAMSAPHVAPGVVPSTPAHSDALAIAESGVAGTHWKLVADTPSEDAAVDPWAVSPTAAAPTYFDPHMFSGTTAAQYSPSPSERRRSAIAKPLLVATQHRQGSTPKSPRDSATPSSSSDLSPRVTKAQSSSASSSRAGWKLPAWMNRMMLPSDAASDATDGAAKSDKQLYY